MHTTNLHKVGGSIMLAVPPAFLNQLHLQAGTTVGMIVSGGHLVIDPNPKPRYTLAELHSPPWVRCFCDRHLHAMHVR